MPDATLQDQVQDIPLWWLILFLVLASLAGELYRADQRQRITRGLLVRHVEGYNDEAHQRRNEH